MLPRFVFITPNASQTWETRLLRYKICNDCLHFCEVTKVQTVTVIEFVNAVHKIFHSLCIQDYVTSAFSVHFEIRISSLLYYRVKYF